MTDLVLPASAPIETYIDETVSVLAELMEDTPKDVLAGFDFSAQGVWAFARPGAPPLKADESLDDAGVVDGSLLTLVSVSRTERYRPLVEDVIDAIAVLDESPEFDRTALNRFVGLAIPVATGVTVMSLVAWSRSGQSWYWPVALGVLGLAVLGGTCWRRIADNIDMTESLLAAAVPVLAGAVRGGSAAARRSVVGSTADCRRGPSSLLTLATRGGPSVRSCRSWRSCRSR
jgi:type VII secretion integral membrane protein EccD